MRWNEMRWEEIRWDEMRWNDRRWNEMRWKYAFVLFAVVVWFLYSVFNSFFVFHSFMLFFSCMFFKLSNVSNSDLIKYNILYVHVFIFLGQSYLLHKHCIVLLPIIISVYQSLCYFWPIRSCCPRIYPRTPRVVSAWSDCVRWLWPTHVSTAPLSTPGMVYMKTTFPFSQIYLIADGNGSVIRSWYKLTLWIYLHLHDPTRIQ